MKHSTWFGLLLAALAAPAMAEVVGFECSGPGGPYNGNPDYGLNTVELISDSGFGVSIGTVDVYNTREDLKFIFKPNGDIQLTDIQLWTSHDLSTIPVKADGTPFFGKFPYLKTPMLMDGEGYEIVLSLEELDFTWGGTSHKWWYLIHGDWASGDSGGDFIAKGPCLLNENDKYTYNPKWIHHPKKAHFIDSPVGGLGVDTPTFKGKTDESGGWDFFPGEHANLHIGDLTLGSVLAAHKVSPLNIFESADTDDARVINMARLLQSLDAYASPKDGILITGDVESCLNLAMAELGLTALDFSSDAATEALIQKTIASCEGLVGLVAVTAEEAKENLERSLDSSMLRKNVSKTPELTSSKSKVDIMGMWFPALRANGEPADFMAEDGQTLGIPYYDENGDLIRVAYDAKPIVVTYTDGVEETGYEDIFAAISRDDGNSFKRKNLSRAADRSSFELANGNDYYGEAKKPVVQVNGNNILVAWTSKFCNGGKPAYAITTCDDPATEEVEVADENGLCRITCTGNGDNEVCEPDYPYDDPYYTKDIWGVGGPQRSVDYTEQGFPEVGEVPYSCVWTVRGTLVTQDMIDSGGFWAQYGVGDIVWFKPERLTSGRRDAYQIFMGGADGAGFAIAWQEDPEGLRPGDAAGPGPGWGGATTNHKTDIWYSYISTADFRKIDANFVSGGDPQHAIDVLERPKALVPMSLPVRVSDNDTVNTDNLLVELNDSGYPVLDANGNWIPIVNPDAEGEGEGTHAYGYEIDGLCEDFYEFINNDGATKRVCITADARLLDGDTGASRPNVFLQAYTKPDGSKSAWAIVAYEETKGAGIGPPDHDTEDGIDGGDQNGADPVPEEGKNVIYHSFDFQTPDKVSAGTIINLPEREIVVDENGNAVLDENGLVQGELVYLKEVSLDADGNVIYGDLILDYLGRPQLAYENARRPRFILQGKSAMGASETVMLILYKEGREGHGRPSDIMMRRVVAPDKGNPYAPANVICNAMAPVYPEAVFPASAYPDLDRTLEVCVDGSLNMSSVSPTVTTDSQGEPTSDDPYGAVKVVEWEQTSLDLKDPSWVNPYDDSRAHRGAIRGDFVVMGYTYTPNWAASRNGHDKYDFFTRRSFDGGQTWTTDPEGQGVTHCKTWTYPSGTQSPGTKIEECKTYDAGAFEEARNLSQLPNSKESVIEPRIVAVPGAIKDPATGFWTGKAEDKQNPNVFYVSYGTSTNPPILHGDTDEVQEFAAPQDLYYSLSQDRGESFNEVTWLVNGDSDGNYAGEEVTRWDWLAKGDPEQGEAQLRMTPDGSRFYATWLEEGADGSDIMFRRIMPPTFPVNVAAPVPAE